MRDGSPYLSGLARRAWLASSVAIALTLGGAAQAHSASGVWERSWGMDVDSVNPSGSAEICTVEARCQKGAQGGGNGEFLRPFDAAADASGNVYVTDQGNHRIEKFDASGQFLLSWGTPGSQGGQFVSPDYIATDTAGHVFVADLSNGRIQKFDSSGNFLLTWGRDVDGSDPDNGPEICTVAASCKTGFNGPLGGEFPQNGINGLATDAAGHVFVTSGLRVQEFDLSGGFLRAWGKNVDGSDAGTGSEVCLVATDCLEGSSGALGGEFASPLGIAADGSGDVYVGDSINRRVQKFSPSGGFLRAWGKNVDGSSGLCTVAANCQAGATGVLGGEFNTPTDLATDPAGNIYVVDINNLRVQKFDSSGTFMQAWGKDVDGSNGGTDFEVCQASSSCKVGVVGQRGGEFNAPVGLGTDAAGDLYVVNGLNSNTPGVFANNRVDKFTDAVAPTVSGVSPASPANDNFPKIVGTAGSAVSVQLYTNAGCTGGAVANDTAAAFASPGIATFVADDSSTTFYATATYAGGSTSTCSTSAVTYVEDSTPPGMPTVTGSDPASPADNSFPKIIGSAANGTTVRLYTNSACTGGSIASGTAAAFITTGITVTVPNDSTTTFYAIASDLAGNASLCSTTSTTYVELAPTIAPVNQTPPSISGTAGPGETLTASHGTWAPPPASYTYSWLACDDQGAACVAIPGANQPTYQVTAASIGGTLRVRAVATNEVGDSLPIDSAATAQVAIQPPTNTSMPNFSPAEAHFVPGPRAGETLTGYEGAWTGSPTEFRYQWRRCDGSFNNCADIPGATSPSYTLTDADIQQTVRLRVVAVNVGGNSEPADSDPSQVVRPHPPLAADFSVSPQPTCTRIPVTFDASSSVGPAPIVRYRFEFDERVTRIYLAEVGGRIVHDPDWPGNYQQDLHQVIADGSSATAPYTFIPNTSVLIAHPNGQPFPPITYGNFGRTPQPVTLTVTDSTGATAQVTKTVAFKNSQWPGSNAAGNWNPEPGCVPLAQAASINLPGASGVSGNALQTSMTCSSGVACFGDATVTVAAGSSASKTVLAASGKAKRTTRIATGVVDIQPGASATVRLRLTNAGRKLLKKHKKLKARLDVRLISPSGKTAVKTTKITIKGKSHRQT
jgi:NHL repeat